MGTFSLVHHAIWEDEAVRQLDGDGFRLFLWSFTNGTSASLTGFTEASSRKIRRAVWPHERATEDRLEDVLMALAAKPLVLYDWDAELLLAVERPRYSVQNPNQAKAAAKWVAQLPPSPLVEQYRERYAHLFGGAFVPPVSDRTPAEKARARVHQAVKSGKLVRPDECEQAGDGECTGPIEGHHADYARPLDVQWLCRRHHGRADAELRNRTRNAT